MMLAAAIAFFGSVISVVTASIVMWREPPERWSERTSSALSLVVLVGSFMVLAAFVWLFLEVGVAITGE